MLLVLKDIMASLPTKSPLTTTSINGYFLAGFELRVSHAEFFSLAILEMGSPELYPWAAFEPKSS
jgi:hypothetical protein